MKRPIAFVTRSPSACEYGADQSVQVSSGLSVFPVLVWSVTAPVDSHRTAPHVEALFVSRTGETYEAGDCSEEPTAITRPGFAVANATRCPPVPVNRRVTWCASTPV